MMKVLNNFINENKKAILFALLFMIGVSAAYLAFGPKNTMESNQLDSSFFDGAQFKVAFSSNDSMKLFAYVKNSALAKLTALEGSTFTEDDAIVIGFNEAKEMQREKLFTKPGDSLNNFFGLNRTTIAGVLEKTSSPVDEIHFLGKNAFEAVNASSDRVFAKTFKGLPELLYVLNPGDELPPQFKLEEGNMNGYSLHNLGNGTYYPIVIGSQEAQKMREEKEFVAIGDLMRNYLDKNFIVVGVLKQTNSSMDIMQFIPLQESQMK
ncbi:MAG: hypothetical protein V1722_05835 [Candidatus Micrarchaeota archaeon]